jgi:hypothetical protein
VRARARIGLAAGCILAVVLIALLAAQGGTPSKRPDPAVASVEACARRPAPDLLARLPAGLSARPLDSLVTGAAVDRLAIPAEISNRITAREIDSNGQLVAAVMVMPAGAERARLLEAVVTQAGGLPEEVRLGGTTGTLVRLRVSGRAVVGIVAFTGCRALFVGGEDEAVVRAISTALAGVR